MAEQYGEKPKLFTKKWWIYFWDYYRWLVITLAALVVVFCGFGYHIYRMEKFDLTITYAGPHYFPNNHIAQINTEFSEICTDVNGDGETLLSFATIAISDKDIDLEYKSSMIMSLQFALEEEEKYVFTIHKDYAKRFTASTAVNSRYEPTQNWLTADVKNADFLSAHNLSYGVSLKGSKIFEKWNCNLDDHFLLLRKKPSDKKELPAYNAAIEFANKLLAN